MIFLSQHWPAQPMSGEQPTIFSQALRQLAGPLARLASPVQSQQAIVQQWGSAGASVTLTAPDLIALLERLYLLQQRERVLTFLESRPSLVALLLEAFGVLQVYFQGLQISLRPVDSAEGSEEQLGIYILVPASNPAATLARLAAFDEAWWLDAMDRARGDLFITVTTA